MIKTYLREQENSPDYYSANLANSWIPALDNGRVEHRLKERGLKVADIGCGYGISTILMAKAYPNSKFYGFDNHPASIEYARNKAREEGLGEDRIQFEVASSTNFPPLTEDVSSGLSSSDERQEAEGYDLIAFFDCLHDMEDPQRAAAHALKTLKKPDGTVMIVEPFANDKLEDNLNPTGRMMYDVCCFNYGMCACVIKSKWACLRCTSRRSIYITSSEGWWL
jgi:SAM-dependent methyltransferase